MKVKVSVICKTDFPIYSLEYYINNQKEQLLLGGGGGSGPTGVPNKLALLNLDPSAKDPLKDICVGDKAVMNLCLHPSRELVICGLDAFSKVYKLPSLEETGKVFKTVNDNHNYQKVIKFDLGGDFLFTGGTDGYLKIWKYPDFVLCKKYDFQFEINDMSIQRGGAAVACTCKDGSLRVAKLKPAESCEPLVLTFYNKNEKFSILSCSYYGALLYAVASNFRTGFFVLVYDAAGYRMLFQRCLGSELPIKLCLSPCGNYMALGTTEGEVLIIDNKNLKKVAKSKAHSWFVSSLAWNEDSTTVFSGGGDSAVCKTKLLHCSLDCHKFILLLSLIVTALAVWLQFFRNFFFKYE
ncbi:uncharacterized protein LOC135143460 [Zophobas morio]|jgi:prolactin regulatory element-binding protein|uniref:uncharacterized protein LOC135143460 n=1 Tax=Zophobas morio TaxID=2755281 RepID=UPI003082BBDF